MFTGLSRGRGGRGLGVVLLVSACLVGVTAGVASAQGNRPAVKVMTYNMDAGTDFLYFLALPVDQLTATQLTYQEVVNTDFKGRAGLMADRIAAEKPALVGLQEVTVWETVSAAGRRHPLADQLTLLLAALWARHQFYWVAGVQNLTDLVAPIGDGSYLRFLDRNAILVRLDLDEPIWLSNLRKGVYGATIEPLPGFVQVNGWMSVDGRIGNRRFRFFTTHLESPVSETDATQYEQGLELIGLLNASPYPVILVGDFNSDASGGAGKGIDQTPTAGAILQAGYAEVWQALRPGDNGFTWPLYFEDLWPGRTFFSGPERIDLVFTRDTRPLAIKRVGTSAPFPSDHAGVVATLQLAK
jgi:hypothetical protein